MEPTTNNPSEPNAPIYADEIGAAADRQAFLDACASMSADDWAADNDWLASAGWGEM